MTLVGGLPGAGKSTLAHGLATAHGWHLLRTDEVRRELAGANLGVARSFGHGRYSPDATEATYVELLRRATELVAHGESVVLDASWMDEGLRARARAIATDSHTELFEICCEAPSDVAARRIESRLARQDDPSEATPEIREAMARSVKPWVSATHIDTTTRTPAETLAVAVADLEKSRLGGGRDEQLHLLERADLRL